MWDVFSIRRVTICPPKTYWSQQVRIVDTHLKVYHVSTRLTRGRMSLGLVRIQYPILKILTYLCRMVSLGSVMGWTIREIGPSHDVASHLYCCLMEYLRSMSEVTFVRPYESLHHDIGRPQSVQPDDSLLVCANGFLIVLLFLLIYHSKKGSGWIVMMFEICPSWIPTFSSWCMAIELYDLLFVYQIEPRLQNASQGLYTH